MKLLSYLFIFSLIAICSCSTQNNTVPVTPEISLIGKWHRFSFRNGYSEFEIDSQNVVFFNQKTGRIKLGYKIENDSFKYIGHNYAAKFTDYGDSVFFKGNDSSTATLYRFIEPDIPFSTIPEENDSLFEIYIKGFDQRMIKEYEKIGITFSDFNENSIDPNQSFQKLLDNKAK